MSPDQSEHSSVVHCRECQAPLRARPAVYCVQCGTRRGRLPAQRGRTCSAGSSSGGAGWRPRPPPPRRAASAQTHWYDSWLQAPRAAAVAVLSMLVVRRGRRLARDRKRSRARWDRWSVVLSGQPGRQPAGRRGLPAPVGSSGSSGGGGTQTITVTSGGGSAPAAGSSGQHRQHRRREHGGRPTGLNPVAGSPPLKHVFMIVPRQPGLPGDLRPQPQRPVPWPGRSSSRASW